MIQKGTKVTPLPMTDNDLFSKLNPYLSTILSHLSNLVIYLDLNYNVIELNPAAEQYYDCKKDQIIGISFIEFCKNNQFACPFSPNDIEAVIKKSFQEFTQTITCKTGKKRSAIWQMLSLDDNNNSPYGFVLIGNDTTREKSAENNIKNIEKRLESIIESIAGNHWWKDINGRYFGFNGALAQELGLSSAAEIIGKTDYDMPWANNAHELIKNDRLVIESGIRHTHEEQVPVKDGRILTFLVTKTPLRDGDGNIIGTIGTSVDITELKSTQLQLMIAKEKAESANKAKLEFMTNMGHDLRTPLAGMVGMAEILEKQVSEENKKIARDVVQAGKVLLSILNEIIEYIKVETDSLPLHDDQFNIKTTINDIIDLMLPSAEQKHLALQVNIDNSIPGYLIGDEFRLTRILLNIISNAIKFTEKGNITINAELCKQNENDVILKIAIADTGMGIAEHQLDQIFARFTRLTPAHQGTFKGTGLGLSVVKQFIKEMNGEIYVESKLNEGSTFICVLPFKKSLLEEKILKDKKNNLIYLKDKIEKIDPRDQNKLQQSLPRSIHKEQPVILLVEDDLVAQRVAKVNLEALHCQVDIASSGNQALEMYKQKAYDLILMDIGLPDIDGCKVTEAIRKDESNGKHPICIVALTAHADIADKQRCLQVGINDVLTKPLLHATAQNILRTYLKSNIQHSLSTNSAMTNSSKIIDLTLGAKLIGQDAETAKTMLKVLVEQLPDTKKAIETAFQGHNYEQLLQLVHKLHGAAAYCGVPRLKDASADLEKILKSTNISTITKSYQKLITEITAVLKAYQELE